MADADVEELELDEAAFAALRAQLRAAWQRGGRPADELPEALAMSEPRHFTDPNQTHTGFLAALWLDVETAAQLALPDGEPADALHITLCYCGDIAALGDLGIARALVALENEVTYQPAVAGRIGGYGRFTASETSDGQDVFYAAPDIAGLAELRQTVVNALRYAGCDPSTAHGFTPHITLAYLDPGAANPVDSLPALDLRFAAVTVMVGDKRYDLPLSATMAMFALREGDEGATHIYQPATFAEAPEWSPFLPVPGIYEHPLYGTLNFTPETYDRIIDHFKQGVYQEKIPVTVQHEQYSSAVGWIVDLRLAESGAIEAKVEWNDRGRRLIADDRYLYVSAEVAFAWSPPDAPETVYQDVALGLTLCTRPYFKERVLPPLAASEAVLTRQEVVMGEKQPEGQTPPAGEPKAVQLTEAEITAFRQFQEAGGLKVLTDLSEAKGKITALETDARRKRFTDIVLGKAEGSDGARWFGETEDHVTMLCDLADTHGEDSDQVKRYIRTNTAYAEQMRESNLFREVGTGRGTEGNGPMTEVEAQARAFREADPALTQEQAYAKALAANPAAYDAALKERG